MIKVVESIHANLLFTIQQEGNNKISIWSLQEIEQTLQYAFLIK